jgi:hypothetical protein
MGCPFRTSSVGSHQRLHDQGLCRAHDSGNTSRFLDHPRGYPGGPADCASDSAELGNGSGLGRIAGFFDDRQRAWRHLLHLKGALSTGLVSARLGGEYVAGCADPPSELQCRMEARWMDWETSESVAGVARPLRRAAALIWVRANQEGPRSPAAVLIIFGLLWDGVEETVLSFCMHRE